MRPLTAKLARGLLAAALASGCTPATKPARPVVVVSVPPQARFVEAIAGDLVDVVVMLPAGASPATYQPSMGQLRALSEASLYVAVGHPRFPFEAAWLEPLLAEAPGVTVVDGSAGVTDRTGDPHVWLVPRHVRATAERIHAALRERLPEDRAALDANLARFQAEIDALDAELRERLAPLRGGRFLVFHPAWGSFATEYGLVQVAIQHEHKEPDAHGLAERIASARETGVRVVFVQPQFERNSAELVAAEVGAQVEVLDPLARDWADNLRRAADALAKAARP